MRRRPAVETAAAAIGGDAGGPPASLPSRPARTCARKLEYGGHQQGLAHGQRLSAHAGAKRVGHVLRAGGKAGGELVFMVGRSELVQAAGVCVAMSPAECRVPGCRPAKMPELACAARMRAARPSHPAGPAPPEAPRPRTLAPTPNPTTKATTTPTPNTAGGAGEGGGDG